MQYRKCLARHVVNFLTKRAAINRMAKENEQFAQNEAFEKAASVLANGLDAFLAREILRRRGETSAVVDNTQIFLERDARVQFNCPPPHGMMRWHGKFGRVGGIIRDRHNIPVGIISVRVEGEGKHYINVGQSNHYVLTRA